jgi:hypothetical protein
MLKTVLFIGFVIGLSFLPGAAAFAQGKCADWCQQNRCGHGVGDPARCMHVCVAMCQEKHAKGAQKKQ